MSERSSSKEIADQLKANSKFFWAAAVTAVAACAFAWSVFVGPGHGLPAGDRLIRSSGHLISHEWGYRSYTIRLRIDSDPREFVYTEKMGEKSDVWASLCNGCAIDIWTDPKDQRGSPFAFQIAINSRIIRSYKDVKAGWLADEALSPMFMTAFGLISCTLLGFGLFRGRRLEKTSKH